VGTFANGIKKPACVIALPAEENFANPWPIFRYVDYTSERVVIK